MPSEQQFIQDAVAHIRGLAGDGAADLGPDTDLQAAGWFDSLMLLSFLDFVEAQRGSPIEATPGSGLPMERLVSVRKAYELVAEAA